jgi:D-tyrosyl-tRNA(Tyr) deacylase
MCGEDEEAFRMRAVVQRVTRAAVRVEGETVGRIGAGLLVLLGVARGDGEAEAAALAGKTARLRIFEDGEGRMNRSLLETGGEALVVSQFTLLGDTRRGNRPGFTDAAAPAEAEALYERYAGALRAAGVPVATGRFRAHMEVELVNDGPVTLLLQMPPAPAS